MDVMMQLVLGGKKINNKFKGNHKVGIDSTEICCLSDCFHLEEKGDHMSKHRCRTQWGIKAESGRTHTQQGVNLTLIIHTNVCSANWSLSTHFDTGSDHKNKTNIIRVDTFIFILTPRR